MMHAPLPDRRHARGRPLQTHTTVAARTSFSPVIVRPLTRDALGARLTWCYPVFMRAVVLLGSSLGLVGTVTLGCHSGGAATDAPCRLSFSVHPGNPVIGFQDFGGFIWNDPSVRSESGQYRMWLSNGTGPLGVAIHEARSTDGLTWALAAPVAEPQLVAGPSAWDAYATETPSLVKVGGTYHLFYTAVPDETFVHHSIGHATSTDGVTWQKAAEPAVPRPTEPNEWGWLGVAEPGATVKDGVIYLYYAIIRCRGGFSPATGCTGTPLVERGIGLSTSTDGITFTADPGNPILVQSASYPASELYEGYSTPQALYTRGRFYLFYDVAQVVDGAFRQVALAYAVSDDGRVFEEVGPDLLVRVRDPRTHRGRSGRPIRDVLCRSQRADAD